MEQVELEAVVAGGGTPTPGTVNGIAGTANTGGGGGGGSGNESPSEGGDGKAGGSGIVIIRYRFQN